MARTGRDQANRIVGLQRLPGGTIKQNEDGSYSASVKYICAWDQVVRLMPRRGRGRHPDFPSLKSDGVEARRKAPGVAEINASYKGRIALGEPPEDIADETRVQQLSRSVSQEPIETHPNFESTIAGVPGNTKNNAKFDDEGKFTHFGEGSRHLGLTSFLSPGATYSDSFEVAIKPTSISVGKIVDPDGAPSVSGAYNWLAAGQSWTLTAEVYQVSEEYILSGPRGWDTEIYP